MRNSLSSSICEVRYFVTIKKNILGNLHLTSIVEAPKLLGMLLSTKSHFIVIVGFCRFDADIFSIVLIENFEFIQILRFIRVR